jgi:hypothetical protein
MIEFLLRKKYFYPNEYNKTIFDIDFEKLNEKGIQFVLIDLDNTLIPYDLKKADEEIKNFLLMIQSLFQGVIIISNNKENRVKTFCHDLDCDYIFSAKKPFKFGFKKALKRFNNPNPASVALIGDQFMTDVFGGNRMGFYTIVVDAIKRKTEKWYTKINRLIEKRMMRRIERSDSDFYDKMNLKEKR